MKKIKQCLICQRRLPKTLAYQGEVEYLAENQITGELTIKTLTGYICPLCNERAGYSTSQTKLDKFSNSNENKQ